MHLPVQTYVRIYVLHAASRPCKKLVYNFFLFFKKKNLLNLSFQKFFLTFRYLATLELYILYIIFNNFQRVLTQQQCSVELNYISGDKAPSGTGVYRLYADFIQGRRSRQNEFRKIYCGSCIY